MSTDFSLDAIYGNITYSKRDVYAYYSVPPTRFEFASNNEQISAASALNGLLSSVSNAIGDELDYHILVSSYPLRVDEWRRGITDATSTLLNKNVPQSAYELINHQAEIIEKSKLSSKEMIIGFKLGSRSGSITDEETTINPITSAFTSAVKAVDKMLAIRDAQVTEGEHHYWKKKEQEFYNVVSSGNLSCWRTEPWKLALAIQKYVNPLGTGTLPLESERWGRGSIKSLVSSRTEKKSTHLIFNYPNSGKTFTAVLVFAQFPTQMEFPMGTPWIFATQVLAPGSWFSSRGKLVPPSKVRSQLANQVKMIDDERKNAQVANHYSIDIEERSALAQSLEHEVKGSNTPWAYGNHRIVLSAPTEGELRSLVSAVTQHFHQRSIELAWPIGDQWKLFLEGFPGESLRVPDYTVRQTLPYLGGGLPHGASSVGDRVENGNGWRGPLIAKTISSIENGVFFDQHSVIARNKAPGSAHVGASGSGKTFSFFNRTSMDTMLGKAVVYVENKSDSMGIKDIPQLEGKVKTYILSQAPAGVLDPFSMYPNDESRGRACAIDAIATMLGPKIFDHYRITVTTSMQEYVSMTPEPSLMGYVDYLQKTARRGTTESDLRDELKSLSQTEFANLMFFKKTRTTTKVIDNIVEPGLTIVSFLGVSLPKATKASGEYTQKEKIGLALLNLLLDKIGAAMIEKPKYFPMSIYLDEFQNYASTQAGRDKVDYLLREGRSHNVTINVACQSPSDIDRFSQHINSRFFFKVEDGARSSDGRDEMEIVAKLLGVTIDDARVLLPNLPTGYAFMRDVDGNVSALEFFPAFEEWLPYFETNPIKRAQREAEQNN